MIKLVALSLLIFLEVNSFAQETDCLKSMRVGVFTYLGTEADVEIIRTDSLNTEIFNDGEIKYIERIEWLSDSTYVMTQMEVVGAEIGCIKNGDKIWITILTCENDQYTYKWTSENCGSGTGNHTIKKIE